jgi:hypothetical protein
VHILTTEQSEGDGQIGPANTRSSQVGKLSGLANKEIKAKDMLEDGCPWKGEVPDNGVN